MNTKDIGEKSEAKIMSALLDRDITVLKPWGDNKRYDFVIEKNGFHRIQCKTGKVSGDTITFSTKSVTTREGKTVSVDYKGQADYFMVYCPELGFVYCVKVDDCGKDQCSLRLMASKNKQTKGVRMADDYRLERSIF